MFGSAKSFVSISSAVTGPNFSFCEHDKTNVLIMKCKPMGLKMIYKNDLYLFLENNFSIKFVHIVVL